MAHKRLADGTPEGAEALSAEQVRSLLRSRRRRYVLYCLYQYANPLTLLDVTDRVLEWESGTTATDRLRRRHRVYAALQNTHVPALEAAEAVVFSRTEDMVELGTNAGRLRPHLERTVKRDFDANGPQSQN